MLAWGVALVGLLRGTTFLLTALATAVATSALLGAWIGSSAGRWCAGLGVGLVLPWLLWVRLRSLAARRTTHRPRLGGAWFWVGWNVTLLAVLALGFSSSTGRALRRRGDWFLGEAEGWFPTRYRGAVASMSRFLERFDLPGPVGEALASALPPALPERPSGPARKPGGGPDRPPERPSVPAPGLPSAAGPRPWYHPLAGPARVLPPNASCRFGAPRPGLRALECEQGHCGVDLARPTGTPVYAVQDGVVLKAVRDERAGGRAGRYIKLEHLDGAVTTSYVHLDELRADLRPGMFLRGGEVIGTVGRTGVLHSGAHLHFSVAVQKRGAATYIDPEPLLWFWRLPEPRNGEAFARRGG